MRNLFACNKDDIDQSYDKIDLAQSLVKKKMRNKKKIDTTRKYSSLSHNFYFTCHFSHYHFLLKHHLTAFYKKKRTVSQDFFSCSFNNKTCQIYKRITFLCVYGLLSMYNIWRQLLFSLSFVFSSYVGISFTFVI